jgi:two-component system nitrate/nitrite response regulator NarL
MPRPPIRVLVAEDHPLYRQGLAEAIRIRPEFSLIGEAGDGRTALEQIRELEPDVAVLDIKMPQIDGLRVLRAIERDGLETRVLLISAFTEGELVHDALTHGAAGFLSKESSGAEICDAIATAARGDTALGRDMQSALAGELRIRGTTEGPRLSEREAEILRLLAEGMSSGEIADQLIVSVTTVKTHLRNLYDKLEVSDRAAAVAQAMRGGLLE